MNYWSPVSTRCRSLAGCRPQLAWDPPDFDRTLICGRTGHGDCVLPADDEPVGLPGPMAISADAVLAVLLPYWSTTRTVTGGATSLFNLTFVGCCPNANSVAAPTVMVAVWLVQPIVPVPEQTPTTEVAHPVTIG